MGATAYKVTHYVAANLGYSTDELGEHKVTWRAIGVYYENHTMQLLAFPRAPNWCGKLMLVPPDDNLWPLPTEHKPYG